VRYIEFEKIVETVKSLSISANYHLSDDVITALQKALRNESNPTAAGIIRQIIENARIAKEEEIPLCQDTGLAVVFLEQGCQVALDSDRTIVDAVNAGIEAGYQAGYLRKSVVSEPMNKRINTDTNTPAVIHQTTVPGEQLKISVMTKGGGCENKSLFRMFKPTADKQQIIDWVLEVVRAAGADACPPFIVGVGIGGNFELSCILSKKALLRKLDKPNTDSFYANLEDEILSRINALGIGPQGLGGDTTALATLIETAPCHIASLPVAVNIECHSHRHKTVVL
jgi:fumarate hydratase subunit alpha